MTARHFLTVVAIVQGGLLAALMVLIVLNRWFRLRRSSRLNPRREPSLLGGRLHPRRRRPVRVDLRAGLDALGAGDHHPIVGPESVLDHAQAAVRRACRVNGGASSPRRSSTAGGPGWCGRTRPRRGGGSGWNPRDS